MKGENFILHDTFNKPLLKNELAEATLLYLNLLKENKYAIKNSSTIYELIESIKRTPENIGPYQHISVFEALNRIGSDLVLLSGAAELFVKGINRKEIQKIHLKMGNIRGFDLEVFLTDGNVIYGEAFNASPSFCKEKMRQAIIKLMDQNPDKNASEVIVFINEEVESILKGFISKNERTSKLKIHRVYCGKII